MRVRVLLLWLLGVSLYSNPPHHLPPSFFVTSDGVWNNALGMVGFVGQMKRADDQFQARLARERALAAKVAAKRAAEAA